MTESINTALPSSVFAKRRLPAAVVLAIFLASQAHAGPEGGNVVGGDGSISQIGKETTILQSSDRLAVDWESFDVAVDERVQFIQPGVDSIALNRILGNDASQIHGQIDANGQVILVNPNGILFGENATVNVGGLVASGININTEDFLNGDLIFEGGNKRGNIINRGLIEASVGGNIALIGKRVVNEGFVSADLGTVSLASGTEFVLNFDQQGVLGVKVNKAVLQKHLGNKAALVNSGVIEASGGRILLTASASSDIFSQTVNSGDLAADTQVTMHTDGSFTLGKGSDVVNSGTLVVSSSQNREVSQEPDILEMTGDREANKVGSVVLIGENVKHSGVILADASLADEVGGDVLVAASNSVAINKNSTISAASSFTEGGKVTVVGKDINLGNKARISAEGGWAGGDIILGSAEPTGFIEHPVVHTEHVSIGKHTALEAVGGRSSHLFADIAGHGGNISVVSGSEITAHGKLDVSNLAAGSISPDGRGGSIMRKSHGTLGFSGKANLTGPTESSGGGLLLWGEDLTVASRADDFTVQDVAINRALQTGHVHLRADRAATVGGGAGSITLGTPEGYHYNSLAVTGGQRVHIENSDLLFGNGSVYLYAHPTERTVEFDDGPTGVILSNAGIATDGTLIMDSLTNITATEGTMLGTSRDGSVERSFLRLEANATGNIRLDVNLNEFSEMPDYLSDEYGVGASINSYEGDVFIRMGSGINGAKISANNLEIMSTGNVKAEAYVRGETLLYGREPGDLSLSGDSNILKVFADWGSNIWVVDESDLVIGPSSINPNSNAHIRSVGTGATISQAENSEFAALQASIVLEADNIALGADGTSKVELTEGSLSVAFADSLTLNGLIEHSVSGSHIEAIGSARDNTLTVGEHGQFVAFKQHELDEPDPLAERFEIHLGEGHDVLNLHAGLPIYVDFGSDANSVVAWAPDTYFTASAGDLTVDSGLAFYAAIEATNLNIFSPGGSEIDAYISGKTFVSSANAEANPEPVYLRGHLNELGADLNNGGLDVTEESDLQLGQIQLVDSFMDIRSILFDGTISQAESTEIAAGNSRLSITADNVDLGANGTSSIYLANSDLHVTFADSLGLNGSIFMDADSTMQFEKSETSDF